MLILHNIKRFIYKIIIELWTIHFRLIVVKSSFLIQIISLETRKNYLSKKNIRLSIFRPIFEKELALNQENIGLNLDNLIFSWLK